MPKWLIALAALVVVGGVFIAGIAVAPIFGGNDTSSASTEMTNPAPALPVVEQPAPAASNVAKGPTLPGYNPSSPMNAQGQNPRFQSYPDLPLNIRGETLSAGARAQLNPWIEKDTNLVQIGWWGYYGNNTTVLEQLKQLNNALYAENISPNELVPMTGSRKTSNGAIMVYEVHGAPNTQTGVRQKFSREVTITSIGSETTSITY